MPYQTEFVRFSLIFTPCCGTLLCWVNPRLPNYCPECGEKILLRIRGKENVTLVDDEARLIHKAVDLTWQPKIGG